MADPFWKADQEVKPASSGGARPVISLPNPDQAADNQRADAGAANDAVRTDIAVRGEERDIGKVKFEQIGKLRDEYSKAPDVKTYRVAVGELAKALKTSPNPQGDLSLVYSFSKAMDPDSVVRDQEAQMVVESQPWFSANVERVKKQFGMDGSGMFTAEARAALRQELIRATAQRNTIYNARRAEYEDFAKRNGFDPYEVVGRHDGELFIDVAREYDQQRREQGAQVGAPTGQQDVFGGTAPGGGNGTAINPQMRGGLPIGTDITFGQQQPDWWDRDKALMETYGVTPEQEQLIAAIGNQNLAAYAAGKIGPADIAAIYAQNGLKPPAPEVIKDAFDRVIKGEAQFGNFDLSAQKAAYENQIKTNLKGAGFDPTSAGAYGDAMARELLMGNADELDGAKAFVDATLQGQNPVEAYRTTRDASRYADEQMWNEQGGLGYVARGAGIVGSGLLIPGGATRAGAVRGGAVAGGVSGFGQGNGAGDSLGGAVIGGGAGAGLGALANKAGDIWDGWRAGRRAATAESAVPAAMPEGGAPAFGAEPALTAGEQEEIATLAKKATGWGPGARSARQTLATKFAANPEAAQAAQRLGIELPADVLSDNAQGKALVGLTRSQVGSEAETAWKADATRIAQYADQAMADLGGSPDLAQLSDDVLNRLNGTADALQNKAAALRSEVDAAIDPAARIDTPTLQETLSKTINDYGGLDEARAAMTPVEKDLLKMLGEGENAVRPTYARLNRLRADIGEALNKNRGPWADVNRQQLGQYYHALERDQMGAVAALGGEEIAAKQAAANELFTKMYGQRAEMQDLFGKNLEKSLAPMLNRAVTTGAKGDASALTKLLDRLPEDVRGGAVVSAIMKQSQTSAAHGGFSFANYTKLYRGLRENSPVFAKVATSIGPKGTAILNDLYAISMRMADAETLVLKTGKANQGIEAAMRAEGVVSSVLTSAVDRAATGAGAVAGGAVGGPAGSAMGATLATSARNAISGGGASRLDKVHGLLSSPQFRDAISKIGAGANPDEALQGLWNTTAFHRLGRSLGLLTPASRRSWLARLGATVNSEGQFLQEAARGVGFQPSGIAAQPVAQGEANTTTPKAQR